MPTFEYESPFWNEFNAMTPLRRARFLVAVQELVHDLRSASIRPSLRIKRVQIEDAVWEMSWAADGRATFSYGAEVVAGQLHIIWRRVGTHDILRRP